MNKTQAVKLVARVIVGVGTTTITRAIIDDHVEPSNLIQKISVGAASGVIGSMASEATKSHTSAQIDQVVTLWQSLRSEKDEIPENPEAE